VTIYQGELQDPQLCNPIGEFSLAGLPPGRPPGQTVRVTVSCGSSGVVNVTAMDIATGQATTTEVNYRTEVAAQNRASARDRWKTVERVV
jgi:molecular chaperone DnaK